MTNVLTRWLPWSANITPGALRSDLFAAITGASLAIPQAIAFAAIAGLPPEYGFYCAIVAPIIAIVFGSSWHMVCGPTTAISALLFATLHQDYLIGSDDYIQAVITLTFLAGIIQLILGVSGFGIVSQYVSRSVMAGFISGAALLIMISQIDAALQMNGARPENLLIYLTQLPQQFSQINTGASIVSGVTLFCALLIKFINRHLPHYLIALIVGSLCSVVLNNNGYNIETLGNIPVAIPYLAQPNLSPNLLIDLFPSAIAIALIGLLEASSIAKSISLKTHQKIEVNREFIGQGASNIVGSFFSSYMSSGSFTRSGINMESGAKTPLAVIMMSLFLLIALPVITPLFSYLPTCAIASIIILVGWRLFAFKELKHYSLTSKKELSVMVITLSGSLVFSMEIGLYLGVATSIALFLKRSMEPVVKTIAPMRHDHGVFFHNVNRYQLTTCPQLHFFSIEGPLFFGSLDHVEHKFNNLIEREGDKTHWLINGNDISDIDEHGCNQLIALIEKHQSNGGKVYFIMRSKWKLEKFRQYKLLNCIGEDRIYPAKQIAIEAITQEFDRSICSSCPKAIFRECQQLREE